MRRIVVKDGFAYQDGLFTGYDEDKRDYDKSSWDYEIGADGYAVVDETLQHPRCVWNLLQDSMSSIYTPETGRAHLRHAQGQVPEDRGDDRGMLVADEDDDVDVRARLDAAFQGLAEHPRHGDAAADPRQYRRARRRHERVARPFQHPGTDRHRPDVEPAAGLFDAADRKEVDFATYMSTRGFKPLRPNQTSYWQNYKKFFVSFQKSMCGDGGDAGQQLRL